MQKMSILIARFPYGASEHPAVADWLIPTVVKMKADPRIGDIFHRNYDDTPITMTRNRCLEDAKGLRADYVLMIDSDMAPDTPLPAARPFWDTSWDFAVNRREKGPCVIAAPYGGPPPHENVYLFRWVNFANDEPEAAFALEAFTRHEASRMIGIDEVGALPTGLILIDVRCLEGHPKPYFDYEWTDSSESQKGSTEDVFFTRNLSLRGIPQYCNWDSWAGHVKRKVVTKPYLMGVSDIRKEFADAIRRDIRSGENVVVVGPTRLPGRYIIKDGVIVGHALKIADPTPEPISESA